MKKKLGVISLSAIFMAGAAAMAANPSLPANMRANGYNGSLQGRQNAYNPNANQKRQQSGLNGAKTDKAGLKPSKSIFQLVRLLNYAPHPLTEELMRDRPIKINGRNYWFNIKYNEAWRVVGDDEGYMKAIGFEISVIEDGRAIYVIKSPKSAINPKKLAKGQMLCSLEAMPFRFNIAVEDFTKTKKGISELVFKLNILE